MILEYRPKDSKMTHMAAVEQAIEDYTAFDRGDLCADIDRVLGDLIERTMHRYMPRKTAGQIRRNVVQELADKVIEYDKSQGCST